jgi:hypothetical protein
MMERRTLAQSGAAAVTLDAIRDGVHIVTLDRPPRH